MGRITSLGSLRRRIRLSNPDNEQRVTAHTVFLRPSPERERAVCVTAPCILSTALRVLYHVLTTTSSVILFPYMYVSLRDASCMWKQCTYNRIVPVIVYEPYIISRQSPPPFSFLLRPIIYSSHTRTGQPALHLPALSRRKAKVGGTTFRITPPSPSPCCVCGRQEAAAEGYTEPAKRAAIKLECTAPF